MFSDTGKCLGKTDYNIFDHLSVLFYLDFFKQDNQFWTNLFSFVQFPFVQYCNSLIPFDIILLNPPVWITLHLVIRSANMDKSVSWAKLYTFHILDIFEMQIIPRKSIKDAVLKSRLHWISKLNNTIFSYLLKELAGDLHDW